MSQFLGVPQKRTSDLDLVTPLKKLIANYYGAEVTYDDSLQELNNLRKESTFKGIEGKSATTLTALQKYYDQLKFFCGKCPVNDLPSSFKWKDSFDKGGFLVTSSSLSLPSLSFERICVLFNIAASFSDIAATALNEDCRNEYALQLGAKHFQQAAGIFLALKTEAPEVLGTKASTSNVIDLNSSILEILHHLMLAQAQESVFLKASQGKIKDATLSKIAAQVEDYYNECYKLIQVVKSIWPEKEWFNYVQSKKLSFSAIKDYHQSIISGEEKKFGEQIAWLVHALDSFKQAETKVQLGEYVQTYQKKSFKLHEDVVRDNDFIYHARVPEYRLLPSIERVTLVKAAPVPKQFIAESSDLFQGLLPLSVQQANLKLDTRRQEIAGSELKGLQDATATLNGILASLNLPASLEDAPGVDLPKSLQDKSKYVRQKGGVAHIKKMINELPELSMRNKEIIDEIERSVIEEERRDEEMRQKFREKWTRTSSAILNKPWTDCLKSYQTIYKQALEADDKVKQKFKTFEREIQLLSSESTSAIAEAIPSGYHGHNYSNAPCVLRLKQLMQEVNQLKSARESLESRFKNANFDHLKERFMQAASVEGGLNDTAMIAEALGEVYGSLQKEARESKEKQEQLLNEIRVINEDFNELKGGQSTASERDKFFSSLATAHDAFEDLLRHLSEGSKFWCDLTNNLVRIQSKVDDFCYARKTELEELIKAMDPSSSQQIVKSDQQSSYHYFPPPPLPSLPFRGYPTI